MALDRTWYNTLIDDDGSGLTGSVWDKADVDSLMDAVDAELARLDGMVNALPPVMVPWVPSVTNAQGTALSVGSNACTFATYGKLVWYAIYLANINIATATAHLRVTMPPGLALNPFYDAILTTLVRLYIGTDSVAQVLPRSTNVFEVYRQDNAQIPMWTAAHVIGQGFYWLG